MGNLYTKQQGELAYSKVDECWQRVCFKNGIQIYKNKNIENKTYCERRMIMIQARYSLDKQLKIYNYRKYNNEGIVRVQLVEQFQESQFQKQYQPITNICTENTKLIVLTEHIQFRLSEFPQFLFNQTLLLFKETLNSYHKIYQQFGAIHINLDMVGINSQGQVKTWLNQNWALNHPSRFRPTIKVVASTSAYLNLEPFYRDEADMVQNLVDVIQSKNQNGSFPDSFGSQVRRHTSSFQKIKKYINSYIFQHTNLLHIPSILQKSRVIISQKQRDHQTSQKQRNHQIFQGKMQNQIIKSNEHFLKNNQVAIMIKNQPTSFQPINNVNSHLFFNTFDQINIGKKQLNHFNSNSAQLNSTNMNYLNENPLILRDFQSNWNQKVNKNYILQGINQKYNSSIDKSQKFVYQPQSFENMKYFSKFSYGNSSTSVKNDDITKKSNQNIRSSFINDKY